MRARVNSSSTAAELIIVSPDERAAIVVPELPAERVWDPKTSDFWQAVWQSPMRLEWDAADTHKLLMMAYLLDEFFISASAEMKQLDRAYALNKLAKSVMDLGARMGVDPFARRSLQWLLVQTEESEAQRDLARERATASRQRRSTTRKGGLSALG